MKKILVFVYSLAGGGAEKAALLLSNELSVNNYDVKLVLIRKEGENLSRVAENVVVEGLNPILVKFKLPGKLIAFWMSIRGQSFDAMFSMGEWPNTILPLVNKLFGIRCKSCIVEQSSRTFINFPGLYGVGKISSFCAKIAYSSADRIIAVSENVKQGIINILPRVENKIKVINNPCSIKDILRNSEAPVTHRWLLDKTEPVLIAVGRFELVKDYPTLIAAFAEANRVRRMNLLILGSGELLYEIKELSCKLDVGDRVDFLGFQHNPYKYIARADLFIHTSQYEGFPLVFIEAMACGVKIVSTDCNIPEELLSLGLFENIVPVGDHIALAEAVLVALKNKTKEHESKLIGHAKNYDISAIAKKYLGLLSVIE